MTLQSREGEFYEGIMVKLRDLKYLLKRTIMCGKLAGFDGMK